MTCLALVKRAPFGSLWSQKCFKSVPVNQVPFWKLFQKVFTPEKTAQSALRHLLKPKCLKSREQGRSLALQDAPPWKKVSLQIQFAKNFRKFLRKFIFAKICKLPENSGSNSQFLQKLILQKFFHKFCEKSQFLTRASRVKILRARKNFLKNARA